MKIKNQTSFEIWGGGVHLKDFLRFALLGILKMVFITIFLKGLHYELHIMIFTNILKS